MSVRILLTPVILILLGLGNSAFAAGPGNAQAGKTYFSQMCMLCHTADPNEGGGEIGPSLVGLFDRPAGVGDARFAYSAALRNSKLVWNAKTLERFLADPAKAVPGTTMPIPVPAKKDRDDLVAYFESLKGAAK